MPILLIIIYHCVLMHRMVKYCVIYITVNGCVEATTHLLQSGVPYVPSQDFCQDPPKEHFGRHRGLARRSDNPTLYQFGQVVNTHGHSFMQRPVIWTCKSEYGRV